MDIAETKKKLLKEGLTRARNSKLWEADRELGHAQHQDESFNVRIQNAKEFIEQAELLQREIDAL